MQLPVWRQVRGFRNGMANGNGSIDRSWARATVVRDPALREAVLGIGEAYGREFAPMAGEG